MVSTPGPGSSRGISGPAVNARLGWSISLQWQITAAVALGLLTLLGAFGAIAYMTINESTEAALHERETVAGLSAEAIDNLVKHVRQQLSRVAESPALRSRSGPEIQTALADAKAAMSTFESLLLVDLDRGTVWTADGTDLSGSQGWLASEDVAAAARSGEAQVFQIGPVHAEEGHPSLAIVAVPIGQPEPGMNSPVLVGDLHLRVGEADLVALPQFSETSGTTIIDDKGVVLSSTNGAETGATLEHFNLLTDFQESHVSGVALHHPNDGKSHVVAFAPFETIPGGIIVEEREDLVLAIPRRFRRNLLTFGVLGLILTSGIAGVHAWRTMRSVKELTRASRTIAGGILDEPIRIHRNDEIGQLAESFDRMRRRLLEAECQRLDWEQEMERSVKTRTKQVQTLLNRVITAQEEERKRVARELHDVVAQDVATTILTLQRLEQNPNDECSLTEARNRLTNTLKEMRQMISALRPSALDDLGLEAAIRDYGESRAQTQGMHVSFESSGDATVIEGPVQTALFRIVQEAINNAIRHSRATSLQVIMSFGSAAIEVLVEDDGNGFDMNQSNGDQSEGSRLGIEGMKERAAMLNGTVVVESQIGRGTRVRVRIPGVV